MSFDGQVDCQRMLIGPAWPLAIMGKPSVAAPAVATAAPVKNLRPEAVSVFLDCSLLISSSFGWRQFMPIRPRVVLLVTPEPSVANDSAGPIVPPAGPWPLHTPK